MNTFPNQDATLNIWVDSSEGICRKIQIVYSKMPGWMGFSGNGIPHWFSFEDSDNIKMVCASVEPAGLQICANMEVNEWNLWIDDFKKVASIELGYAVGELEDGYL